MHMLFPMHQKLRTAGEPATMQIPQALSSAREEAQSARTIKIIGQKEILWVLVPRMIGNAGSIYMGFGNEPDQLVDCPADPQ